MSQKLSPSQVAERIEKRKARRKVIDTLNRDKRRAYAIAWYHKNHSKNCQKRKEKRLANLEKAVAQERAATAQARKDHPWRFHLYAAKTRCNNMAHIGYKNYGLRGIKCLLSEEDIKKLWFRDDAWLLLRPSIDRIDSDGNYEYANCRFIERSENSSRRCFKVQREKGIKVHRPKKCAKKFWDRILETWH